MKDVLIVTGNGAEAVVFARMLQLEAYAFGFQAEIVNTPPTSPKSCLILCDIDSFSGTDALLRLNKAQVVCYSSVKSEYGGMTVLKRPFEIEQLRKLLYSAIEADGQFLNDNGVQVNSGNFDNGSPDRNGLFSPAVGSSVKSVINESDISLNARTKTATIDGLTVVLTPYEYTILSLLVERRGAPVSVETLSTAVSGHTASSNLVSVYIKHLRRKIDEELDIKLIRTVRKKGYMIK